MGYYAAGDWYEAQGDPGAITKWMPGAGRILRAAPRGLVKALGPLGTAAALYPAGREIVRGGKRLFRRRGRRGMRIFGGRRHRRMNPGNFRALRRSLRRLKSFEKAARSVVHFTRPARGAHTRWQFKRKRRRW